MAEKLKAAAGSFERLVLPRLNSIDGELKAVNTKIESVDKSVNSLRSELKAEIRATSATQDAKINSIQAKVDQIHKDLDIDRRMLIIEAKVRDLEKRT
jgi:archaellum component FlaC